MSEPAFEAKQLIKRYLADETLEDHEYSLLHEVADLHMQILENVVHMKIFEGWLIDLLKEKRGNS